MRFGLSSCCFPAGPPEVQQHPLKLFSAQEVAALHHVRAAHHNFTAACTRLWVHEKEGLETSEHRGVLWFALF